MHIPPGQTYVSPGEAYVEGDASSASYFLAGAMPLFKSNKLSFKHLIHNFPADVHCLTIQAPLEVLLPELRLIYVCNSVETPGLLLNFASASSCHPDRPAEISKQSEHSTLHRGVRAALFLPPPFWQPVLDSISDTGLESLRLKAC